jgi:hypothetical protein
LEITISELEQKLVVTIETGTSRANLEQTQVKQTQEAVIHSHRSCIISYNASGKTIFLGHIDYLKGSHLIKHVDIICEFLHKSRQTLVMSVSYLGTSNHPEKTDILTARTMGVDISNLSPNRGHVSVRVMLGAQ